MRISAETERKIEDLLSQMTLEEKVNMCHANAKFYSGGVSRLGIDELAMMDGPHGVRSEVERDRWTCLNREEDRCTYLPTETALAATFNPALARRFGETLGSEARYRGKDIILGPGVNIIRTPLCGRNFEYMSEDPTLICKLAPELVKGIESMDVASCVKHYALNNQELDRTHVNVEISDRALHEIYLKGFYSAIIEGEAASVMGAYNRYKNQHLCHNKYLVNDVLKDKWGFKGVYLSDWAGCHDTKEAVYNGLDLEMGTNKPYNEYYLADDFLEMAKNDEKVREILDDKVRRLLRLMFSVNKFSENRKKGEYNTKEHQQTTYDIASEAMVLLKNDDSLLPIKKEKNKILVVGPNAKAKHAEGGNSSGVRTVYEVTPYDGIVNRFGSDFEIEYESGEIDLKSTPIPVQILNIIELKAGARAFKHTCCDVINGEKQETVSYTADTSLPNNTSDSYKIEFGIHVPESGTYVFKIKSSVGVELIINGRSCLAQSTNIWRAERSICTDFEYAADFVEGEDVEVTVNLTNEVKNAIFELGWNTPSEIESMSVEEDLIKKAQDADYIIYCGGLNHSFDTEGADKKNTEMPSEQNIMIDKLSRLNENLIVTLTAGSPIEMPWIGKVKAVLWCWYAGMEGGNALADVLLGNVVPSGKMPFTLPKKYEDSPVAIYGEYRKDNCKYNEDIFVGYRGFEKDGIKPLFPFGHGLSYARFDYSDLSVSDESNGITVTFTVKNSDDFTAKETAQVYMGQVNPSVERPIKELVNFEKIELKGNESKEISLFVSKKDLSFYDEAVADFKFESGEYKVYVGSSVEDIRLEDCINIK